MSSQAPRADERLPLVSQRREQHQQLGGGELSRLSTSTAIGAVVVEVQTEKELAVQVNETAEIRDAICSALLGPLARFPEEDPLLLRQLGKSSFLSS